jgi:hypothetical protein
MKLEADFTDDLGNLAVRVSVNDIGSVNLWTAQSRKQPLTNPATGMLIYGNQIGGYNAGLDRVTFAEYLENVAAALKSIT